MYVNARIYNVEHCRVNIVYFKLDMNNVRQRQNNVAIFSVEFYNVVNISTHVFFLLLLFLYLKLAVQ